MFVDLFNFVEVIMDVIEGELSSKKVFKKFGGIIEKSFVIRTNATLTTIADRLFNMSRMKTVA